jgi:hypothetical protein
LGCTRQGRQPSLYNGCVVEDFAQTWNIKLDAAQIERDNAALSAEAVKLLYIYRTRVPKSSAIDVEFLDLLSSVPGPRFRIHSAVCRRVAILDPADLEWASRRTGMDIGEDWAADDEGSMTCEADLLAPSSDTIETVAQLSKLSTRQIRNDPNALADALIALTVDRSHLADAPH